MCPDMGLKCTLLNTFQNQKVVKLSQNPTEPEKYLSPRVTGACEAIDVQLEFNQ